MGSDVKYYNQEALAREKNIAARGGTDTEKFIRIGKFFGTGVKALGE